MAIRDRVHEQLAQLRASFKGDISDSALTRAQYATDASNYRVPPALVVCPRDADDVACVLEWARRWRIPITSRGGGTSTAGNSIGEGIVIDFSRYMNKILAIDPEQRTARVQPGVVMSDLQAAAAPFGLRFGPDPSTQNRATFGGMIGNNACGPHAVAYGKTSDNVLDVQCIDGCGRKFSARDFSLGELSLEEFLVGGFSSEKVSAGKVSRIPPQGNDTQEGNTCESDSREDSARESAPQENVLSELHELVNAHLAVIRTECGRFGRHVSGYSLEHLLPERGFDVAKFLVGTEGTLVTITEATLRLVPIAEAPMLVVLGYPDMPAAADAVPAILKHRPLAIEGMDASLVEMVRQHKGEVPKLPEGGGWLMVEVGAREGEDPSTIPARAEAIVRDSGTLAATIKPAGAEASILWKIRADGAGLGGRTPQGTQAWPGWEDSAVPPENLGAYLRDLQALMDRHNLHGLMYGHFGDGCVHVRIDFPLDTEQGIPVFREFLEQAADIAVSYGGSLSGEHGDGRARTQLLERMYSPAAMNLFAQVKALFDPENLLNPGILFTPYASDSRDSGIYSLSSDLRRPQAAELDYAGGFHFHDHGDSFTHALHHCTGVGKCRANNIESGTGWMCPSYQATREEKDVTRGRMRILQEVAQRGAAAGAARDTLIRGFADSAVRSALDLCLGCKACGKDCPTGIDVARFKSEALYRGYKGRLRPRTHYLLGNLPRFARLAVSIPGAALAANAALSIAPLRKLTFALAGLDTRRFMPGFTRRKFSSWARKDMHIPCGVSEADMLADFLPETAVSALPSVPASLPSSQAPHEGEKAAHTSSSSETPPRYVMLWADSFSETLDTRGAQAMVGLLQRHGYTVIIPPEDSCCGLTWITTGQLDTAKKKLKHLLSVLAPFAAEGIPIVGVEPSCTAVLRDDVLDLLPDDSRASLVSSMTFTLAELLTHKVYKPNTLHLPNLQGVHIVAQPHCHHYSVMGWKADAALLKQAGAQLEILAGCCGLAGNFGMERGHYDVSVAVAERQLLPALRAAEEKGGVYVYLADGFSCRTQAQQLAGQSGVHLAQLLYEGVGNGIDEN